MPKKGWVARSPLLGLCAALGGCAIVPGGPVGVLYSDVKGPIQAVPHSADSRTPGAEKVGVACVDSFFGLFSTGDASIAAALSKAGDLPSEIVVSHLDYQFTSILGAGKYCILVYYSPIKPPS